MAGADSHLARGVRWLRTVPLTLVACTLLWSIYLLELYVWQTASPATFVWLFVARQELSPGWVLAPLAHSPFDVWHLVANVFQVFVFGGIAERRLDGERYVTFLVAAATASTGAQVGVYAAAGPGARGLGVLGASGIALALAAFVVVDNLRYRAARRRWHAESAWIWTLFGAFVVANAVFEGLVGAPGVAVTGHLAGVGLGIAYGLIRSRSVILNAPRSREREWRR